jgi:hypothetical protein
MHVYGIALTLVLVRSLASTYIHINVLFDLKLSPISILREFEAHTNREIQCIQCSTVGLRSLVQIQNLGIWVWVWFKCCVPTRVTNPSSNGPLWGIYNNTVFYKLIEVREMMPFGIMGYLFKFQIVEQERWRWRKLLEWASFPFSSFYSLLPNWHLAFHIHSFPGPGLFLLGNGNQRRRMIVFILYWLKENEQSSWGVQRLELQVAVILSRQVNF